MDQEKDGMTRSIEDLEKEITCGVCKKDFKDPKVLPYGHCFCKQCLVNLSLEAGTGNAFQCPECGKEITLPDSGADGFPTASYIDRLKKYKNLLQARVKDISRKCQVHNDLLVLFCNDCEHVICRDCALKDHKDHNYEYNSEAAPRKKDYLLESIKPLKEVQYDFKMAMARVKAVQVDLNAQGDSVAEYITNYFSELHGILDQCKQNLLEKNQQSLVKKLANLKTQEKELFDAYSDLQGTTESIGMHISGCSDDEIMGVFSEFRKQLLRIKEEYNFSFVDTDDKNELQPVEGMFNDVRVLPPAQFLTDSEALAQFADIPILSGDVAIQNLKQEASVNTTYSFMLLSKKQHAKIEVLMSNPHSLSPIECAISRIGSCSYQVTYTTPEIPCECSIHVLMDGKETASSPISLTVKHCSFLKKLFRLS